MSKSIVLRMAFVATATLLLAGCPGGGGKIVPALKQLPAETQVLLAKSGMTQEAPIFVRIFKEESQLEIWKEKADGRFYHFKTYPICNWSGELGPKVKSGDKQAPEGFYTVTPGQMNPNSQFHLAFNLGYPNAYDKANGRTGSALMVHGDCRSAGCFAMTDALIEEIYALARESFRGGQTKFHVHAFPFRMTEDNMKRHKNSKWYGFWKTLKHGYDDFELSRKPPQVAVCSRQYLVNADFLGHNAKPDPAGNCPAYRKLPLEPFNPFEGQIMAKAPAATKPAGEANRVAAYSPPRQSGILRDGSPLPAQPAAKPGAAAAAAAAPAAQSQTPTAALSSQPPAQPQSAPVAPPAAEDRPVSLAGAVALPRPDQQPVPQDVQPVSATLAPPADISEPAQNQEEEPEVTRGLHNVMQSGKSDMAAPPR